METEKEINSSVEYLHGTEGKYKGRSSSGWTSDETKFLVELYKNHCNNIGPHKMFRTKLHLWNEISQQLNKAFGVRRTVVQCIGHHKFMQNRSKINMTSNSGSLEKIGDSMEISSSEDELMHESHSTIAGVIRSTLLEIHQLKEEAKERRHSERMRLLEKILGCVTENSNANLGTDSDVKLKTGPEPELHNEIKSVLQPLVSNETTLKPVKIIPVLSTKTENKVLVTREHLLEMQRKKMEDRERKHKKLKNDCV